MNEEEAEKELDKCGNMSLGFCPILQAACRIDCVSFRKAWIYNTGWNNWIIFGESCTNQLVTGQLKTV